MKKENNYTLFGISKQYPKREADPKDGRLTVQRLRKGRPRDVQVDNNTFAHTEPAKNESYFGLKDYIRTTHGERKTPTYIFDNHNHALFGWYEALQERHITRGATLIHIDEHDDADDTLEDIFDTSSLSAIARYAKSLQIYNFIAPAVKEGLVNSVIWVQPTLAGYAAIPQTQTEDFLPLTIMGIDNAFIDRVIRGDFPHEQIIVDFDVDYFRAVLENPIDLANQRGYFNQEEPLLQHDLGRVQSLLNSSGVNTIATSPGYIDQSNAISLIQHLI
ncbi:MAG TPA: UPF0489 family protein [Candidatus Saccharimonadales bacterium]|nr:UPF0489 family protein [Candidatus Saccharimonadales bacterium]